MRGGGRGVRGVDPSGLSPTLPTSTIPGNFGAYSPLPPSRSTGVVGSILSEAPGRVPGFATSSFSAGLGIDNSPLGNPYAARIANASPA
ncbi:MAG: hypothetical protein ACRCT8_17940, partial [Lacipirellulaceae bacterium]